MVNNEGAMFFNERMVSEKGLKVRLFFMYQSSMVRFGECLLVYM